MQIKKYLFTAVFLTAIFGNSLAADNHTITPAHVVNDSNNDIRVMLDHANGSKQATIVTANGGQKSIQSETDTYHVAVCWIAHDRANHCKCGIIGCRKQSPTFVKTTGQLTSCLPGELTVDCSGK
jgi:hypothetical protein